MKVLDSNGMLLSDFAVSTGSGANYAFVMPEPGSLVLVAGAITALLLIRRDHGSFRRAEGWCN
ncbi:MAG: hypothetical protein ABI759_21945 [Candidatus Solibacter sp.]